MQKEIIDQKQLIIEEDEIDLIDLLKTIYKNRKLIIAITVAITMLGLNFAFMQKNTYKSEMTFVEQTSNSSNSMLASLASSIPFGLGGGISSGKSSSLTTVLDTRKFREKVVEKLKLRDYLIKINKIDIEAQKKLDMIALTNWIKGAVLISQDTKTGVYKVMVELEDKEMATKIANEYYNVLDDYLKNTKLDKNKINREYLEKQVQSVEKDLEIKQGIVKAFEKKYNSSSIEADSKIAIESVAVLKGQILKTESELNVARGIYGEESLEVKRLKDTLIEFNKQLNNLNKGTGSVKFIPANDIANIKYDLEKLKTEITATTEVYKMLRVQLEQAKLDEISNRSVIELLDSAIEPETSSSTSKKLIILISGVLGLFMGIFVAFVKEFAKGINWQEFKN